MNAHAEHQTLPPPPASQARAVDRGLRVVLVTDTLGDVNGVSRFINNIAECAIKTNRSLHVLTSTRFQCPRQPNVLNIAPRLSRPMPAYPTLDVVWPHRGLLLKALDRLDPDVVHVSTPGPVGWVGRKWALSHNIPLVGTYHTDFPAYMSHLFNNRAMTWLCTATMRKFYRPFARVFSRSLEYRHALLALGVHEHRISTLLPGIDTSVFNPRARVDDGSLWNSINATLGPEQMLIRQTSVKAIYVGRVSVEKNLPWLAEIWPDACAACRARGVDAQLLIVGDGLYRPALQRRLADSNATFLGFRFGQELSRIYASADVFVFPSTTDTLGQVVLESQAAGLPVVVSDQGGPAAVVDDGITGVVLPVSPVALAKAQWIKALVELMCDPPRRARMGSAAAAKVAPMSIGASFDHFWQVHQDVAAQTGRPRPV